MASADEELRLSLRFLSGKHRGSEYVLEDPSSVVVGRSAEADLVLVEGMVSRRHAKFDLARGALSIVDFGSTNGTYVNGERITLCELTEGDRVLVGTTILKVIKSNLPVGTRPPAPPSSKDLDDMTQKRNRMAGGLDEIGVPELVEMFGSARQRLCLQIDSGDGVTTITIAEGKVLDCKNERLPDAPPEKCILRALGYTKGTFRVVAFVAPKTSPLDIPVPELLVDGLFKLDELEVLRQRLPAAGERITIPRPILSPLSALDERELETLQLAYNLGDVRDVLDASTETDLETAKRLLKLIDGGYLRRS